VEGGANEVSEQIIVEALEGGHREIRKICACIEELRDRVGVEKMPFEPSAPAGEIVADVEGLAMQGLGEALKIAEKAARKEAVDRVEKELAEKLLERYGEQLYEERQGEVAEVFESLEKRLMRGQVIETNRRIDGRGLTEVRPISIEVGILPRAHGSCLFTRGETQALVSTTLGTSRDEQRLDELTGESFKRFMLHYNFPPFSVGEVRRIMGPGRREIGHGKLAERALERMLPLGDDDEFPYAVRVLSDITESNGSSSMATVCGGSLSLMDAGVPMKAPVAGIAMGLIKEGEEIRILTDILGVEDHLGDMDFKVCGTRDGITSFQMDIKIQGITYDVMAKALGQAREARLFILDKMCEVLAEPRPDISPYAPRIYTIRIPVDKIRDIIGPGGKVIRGIQSETGADIEVQDDGTVNVAAVDQASAEAAIAQIRSLTAEPEVGQIYKGVVCRIMPFGAFVTIMSGKDGLVHISELAPGRVNEVEDVVQIGDEVSVKVIEIDKMGRVNLSKVQAEHELGLISDKDFEAGREHQAARRDRGSRSKQSGGSRRDRPSDRGGRSGGPRRDRNDRGGRRR